MKKYCIYFSLIFALLFGYVSQAGASDIVVIGNNGIAAGSITKDELKRIYLGKMSRWGNGEKISFCLIKSDALGKFTKEYLGYTSMKYLKHWKKLVFTGKGSMPPFYANDGEVVSFVSSTSGAVGFVSAGADTAGVKVLSVQ